MNIKYRTKTPNQIPSAIEVNGEPVWAEISDPTGDLTLILITTPYDKEAFHLWHAYASDDPAANDFFTVEEHQINDGEQAEFPTYSKALAEAAGYVQG